MINILKIAREENSMFSSLILLQQYVFFRPLLPYCFQVIVHPLMVVNTTLVD